MGTFVVVAGATGGIGSAIVKCLVEKNENMVFALYRNRNKYDRLFGNVSENKLIGCAYEELENVLDRTIKKNVEIDRIVLVLSTFTISPIKRVENIEADELVDNVNCNIILNTNIIRSVMQCCKRNGYLLDIVNLNSGAAYRPIEGWSLYSASKAYMNMFLKSVINENETIRGVSVDPGVVDTDMQAVIRNTPDKEFGMVDTFCKYKENNVLASTEEVAIYIRKTYIENWNAKTFEEKYRRK